MSAYVYDYAGARPGQDALAAAGSAGVCRYIKRWLPNDYDLDAGERADLLAWGQAILYNAEQSAGDLAEKDAAFFRDYGAYVRDRLLSLGVDPAGVNVALSADREVSGKQLSGVINNFAAFAVTVAPFGMVAYAQTDVIDFLVLEKISPVGAKHWLPGAISWSGYDNTPDGWNAYLGYEHAGLVQLGPDATGWWDGQRFDYGAPGAPLIPGTDLNVALDMTAIGFDFPPGHPLAPKRKDPDMPLFRVVDTGGLGYLTDGLTRRHIVGAQADIGPAGDGLGGISAAITAGHVLDGTAYFTPDQVDSIPDSGPGKQSITVNNPAASTPPDPTGPTASLTLEQIAAGLSITAKGATA